MRFALLALVLVAFAPLPARAEVASATPSAFTINAQADIATPPARAWRALTEVGHWWSPAHTYSGDPARRLTLEARAGGCWCERWDGNSVEHARVLTVMESQGVRTLRVQGGLGPLQEMGVVGILTFAVAPNGDGARLTMTYRVSGDAGLGLDQIAAPVDHVLMEQFGRLARYAETGAAN